MAGVCNRFCVGACLPNRYFCGITSYLWSDIMTHTPGPWEFELMLDKQYAVYGQNGRHRIATISNYVEHDDFVNARLIAAAPELLEALVCMLDSSRSARDEYSDMDEAATLAEAAIAKARGES